MPVTETLSSSPPWLRADRNRAVRSSAWGYAKRNRPKGLKMWYVNEIQAFPAKQTQRSYLTCCQLDTAKIRPFFDENKCPHHEGFVVSILLSIVWKDLGPNLQLIWTTTCTFGRRRRIAGLYGRFPGLL